MKFTQALNPKKRVAVVMKFSDFVDPPFGQVKESQFVEFTQQLFQAAGLEDLPISIQTVLFGGETGPVQLTTSDSVNRFRAKSSRNPVLVERTPRLIAADQLTGLPIGDIRRLSNLTDDLICDHSKILAKRGRHLEQLIYMKSWQEMEGSHDNQAFYEDVLRFCEFLSATLICRRDTMLAAYGIHRETNDPNR